MSTVVDPSDETLAAVDADGPTEHGSGERPPRPLNLLREGDRVGRFVVLRKLGAGGMGVVYSAYDPELDRKIALKLLRSELGDDAQERTRLLREAKALAKVTHPNVVTVHDAGIDDERVFLAMEYVEGRTVQSWTDADEPDWARLVDVYVQAGLGLAAAHEKGLVHRDFKPENVMLADDGRVLVMDFGLARVSSQLERSDIDKWVRASASVEVTQAGSLMGTPAFMSPEQFRGEELDPRTDQFSFCVSLWRALFGAPPYDGDSLHARVVALTAGTRRAPANVSVPAWIRRTLDRGLAVDREARWPDMHALIVALKADPGPRRRRRVALAGAAAVGIGLVAAVGGSRAAASRACEARGRAPAEIWTTDRRSALEASFLQQMPEIGADQFQRFDAVMTRHFDSLGAEARSICRAASLEGSMPREQYEGARTCLDRRLAVAEAAVDVLSEGDAAALREAAVLAHELPRPSDCSDPGWLATHAASLKSDVDPRLQRALFVAATLRDAGHPAEARDKTVALLEDVEEGTLLGAQAHRELGRMLTDLGEHEQAVDELSNVYFLAGSLGAFDLAADAARDLVQVHGDDRGEAEKGRAWARHSEMMLEQVGGDTTIPRAALAQNMGLLEWIDGNPDKAKEHHARSLELRTAALGADSPGAAAAMVNLAQAHQGLGEFDEAAKLYESGLEVYERLLGKDHPRTAIAVQNLGSLHIAKGDNELSLQYFAWARDALATSLGAEHPDVGTAEGNLGVALRGLGRLDEARTHFERSLATKKASFESPHPAIATGHYQLGTLHQSLGEYERAIEYFESAANEFEGLSGKSHPKVSIALGAWGVALQALDRHAQALEVLARALEAGEAATGVDGIDAAFIHLNIGGVQRDMDDLEGARASFERALLGIEKSMGADNTYTAVVRTRLGQVEARLGRDSARTHLERALATPELAEHNESVFAQAQFALAKIMWKQPTQRPAATQLLRSAHATFEAQDGPLADMDAWLEQRNIAL